MVESDISTPKLSGCSKACLSGGAFFFLEPKLMSQTVDFEARPL